jgi:hypothetical protein
MKRLLIAISLAAAVPASAHGKSSATDFTLVNATGTALSSVEIRRFGTTIWQPLPVAPPPGARGPVKFADEDCAFDIQAKLADGKTAIWSGINLCGAKAVTLNRNDSGEVWVDYD